jgi:hypothetical protein
VCDLDGNGIPPRYKVRQIGGEPVPLNVLDELERRPEEPWKVRDRVPKEMEWCPKGMTWAQWKAWALTRLFRSKASPGEPSRITAATVQQNYWRP